MDGASPATDQFQQDGLPPSLTTPAAGADQNFLPQDGPGSQGSHPRYRGLSWDKKFCGWRARIYYCGKQRHIGRYTDAVSAARAYDKAAVYLYGDNAITNFGLQSVQADPSQVSTTIVTAKRLADEQQQQAAAAFGSAQQGQPALPGYHLQQAAVAGSSQPDLQQPAVVQPQHAQQQQHAGPMLLPSSGYGSNTQPGGAVGMPAAAAAAAVVTLGAAQNHQLVSTTSLPQVRYMPQQQQQLWPVGLQPLQQVQWAAAQQQQQQQLGSPALSGSTFAAAGSGQDYSSNTSTPTALRGNVVYPAQGMVLGAGCTVLAAPAAPAAPPPAPAAAAAGSLADLQAGMQRLAVASAPPQHHQQQVVWLPLEAYQQRPQPIAQWDGRLMLQQQPQQPAAAGVLSGSPAAAAAAAAAGLWPQVAVSQSAISLQSQLQQPVPACPIPALEAELMASFIGQASTQNPNAQSTTGSTLATQVQFSQLGGGGM